MFRTLWVLTLSLALGGPSFQWAAGLLDVALSPETRWKAGSQWDPNGAQTEPGGGWDPDGGAQTEAGGHWDPDG